MKFINKHKDFFALLIIVLISLTLRLYLIDKVPVNITGDESWDLSHVYRIVFSNTINPLTFLGDGSVVAIVFYPVAILMSIFGIENSVFFLRLNIVAYSLIALVPFYFLLKKQTSRLVAFAFTLLLSANYVFLNFSRTAWVNMMCVFSGLFMVLFLEKATKEKKFLWYFLSGIFAGISFYGYHFGRVLVASLCFYLLFDLFLKRFEKFRITGFFIFIVSAIIVVSPIIFKLQIEGPESILRRPSATYAFSKENLSISSQTKMEILTHQLEYTFRGLILLDSSVMNEGFENSRYVPLKTPPVNIIIKILFIAGLVYFFIKKRLYIWWFVLAPILFVQIISVLPPNYSRGLFYLPFIYFISGLFVNDLALFINKKFRINKNIIYGSLIVAFILIFAYDSRLYFNWMKKSYMETSRQPAISYEEFPDWQNYQINIIKNGSFPITNQAWYEIRNSNIK